MGVNDGPLWGLAFAAMASTFAFPPSRSRATVNKSAGQATLGLRTSDLGPRYDAPVITVVFACVHNAGRSQMAAAFFNAFADPGTARAVSAGTRPAERVHP